MTVVSLFKRIRNSFPEFPRQFWLVAAGVLVSSSGSSMIWPFQLIYVSQMLGLQLSTVATLITFSSGTGLVVSFVGGSIADRFGRKPVMFAAQAAHGISWVLMSFASSYLGFLLPMTIMAAAQPFYAVGSDSMMADLIEPERRTAGYSILRMVNNAGIAIGPAIGGLVVSKSYAFAFYVAAACMLAYSTTLLLFARETLDKHRKNPEAPRERFGGYNRVLQDRGFVLFVLTAALGMISPLMLWTLLAVYTKQNYGLPEYVYSWLPITNALMCVFVQYPITQISRRFRPLPVVATGMLFYAVGVGSIALASGFWGFWLAMVVNTFGELIVVATATTYSANRAPSDLRGRYMSIYWVTWGLARTIAPVIGGFLNDRIAPRAMWYGGLLIGLTSTCGLFILSRKGSAASLPLERA